MKKVVVLNIVLAFMVVLVIPAIIILGINICQPMSQVRNKTFKGEDLTIRVYMAEMDKVVEMNLEEYVKGVVAGEMPAEFDMEALKAQAVAARTYAVRNMAMFGGNGVPGHPEADVSTDYRQGQAWLGETTLKKRWGSEYKRFWNKICRAVDETHGLILTYNGEPIQALFHSTSGERTASAKEAWGFDCPYLKSVPCNWDKASPRYADTKEVALAELEQKLGADAGVMSAIQSGNRQVAQVISRTESNRVDKIRIGNKTITGMAAREKFDLRSTNFEVELKEGTLVFRTVGYGHGVGMCQYGANGMAKEGKDFRYILTYYYTGVAIKNIYGS